MSISMICGIEIANQHSANLVSQQARTCRCANLLIANLVAHALEAFHQADP